MTPSEFVLKDVVIDYRHSVDSGASAVVFRGQFHGQEVAVKRFRIYIRTVERCKKVSLHIPQFISAGRLD